ncbi:MAG: hypothetical protein KF689_12460 [Gemmatimonadaceae bacterium]|nr:hypothetical protein [Gemmatimonadaceae bacterium]MCW5827206.1 hypothetical protein [Gemmatimonadaceae bacterium]
MLGGCTGGGENPQTLSSTLLLWSVDTVAIVGVADGDPQQEFGQLIAAEYGPHGDLALLDLRRPGVSWFDSVGRFQASTRVGRGPGELSQPRAIGSSASGAILALDPASARLSFLRATGGRVSLDSSIGTLHVSTSVCELAGRVYASFLLDGFVAHTLGPDGKARRSFGPEPSLPQATAGTFGLLARRQIVEPRLYCDERRSQVVLAGRSHPLVHAYDSLGQLKWSNRLDGVHSLAFRVNDDGSVGGVLDSIHGASFARSMVAWDEQHLLVQYVRSFPGPPPETREFSAIDSRLLNLTNGTEVERSERLPLVAAARGDRLVILDNFPYPRAIVVRRR